MPFDYYYQLTKRQQRDYRKSDEVESLTLPKEAREPLRDRTDALEAALEKGAIRGLQAATEEFCSAVNRAFGAGPVRVQVKSRRPVGRSGAEYYGMTSWMEGELPLIEMWMRTRAEGRVVAFKTYVRTLIHELLHHLDRSLLGLRETFHTAGFFKRESSLVRQLVRTRAAGATAKKKAGGAGAKGRKKKAAGSERKTSPPPGKTQLEPGKNPARSRAPGKKERKGGAEQLQLPF